MDEFSIIYVVDTVVKRYNVLTCDHWVADSNPLRGRFYH